MSCPPPPTSDSRRQQAHTLCLRLLTARSRTRAELAEQLAKRGYPEDITEEVLQRLIAVGLIDDAQYAEQWIHSRHTRTGKSIRALAAELRNKGIDDDTITTATSAIDTNAERQRAEQLVEQKLRREKLADPDDTKIMRRLIGMLARRGYSHTMAASIVSEKLTAEHERRRV